jgi:hypothetical protein
MTKAAELAKMGEVLTNSQIGGRRNIVINGAMQVAQRGTSATGLGASDGYYTVDRFGLNFSSTSARLTMTQDSPTDLSGFTKALKLDCTTADTSIGSAEYVQLHYRIEGQDLQQLKKGTSDAEKITVSFYVKGNASATYTCEIEDVDNNRYNSQEFSVTTSWTKVTLTYNADTTGVLDNDNGQSMAINFWLHVGSNFTSGTHTDNVWHTTATQRVGDNQTSFADSTDRTFFLTGLQMELGSQATPFEHRSFGEELSLCQRYYTRESAGSGAVYKRLADGICGSTTFADFMINLSTPLRATPTLETSGNVNHYVMYSAGATDVVTALGIATDSDDGTFNHSVSFHGSVGSGLVAGDALQLLTNNNASYYLALDAEL